LVKTNFFFVLSRAYSREFGGFFGMATVHIFVSKLNNADIMRHFLIP